MKAEKHSFRKVFLADTRSVEQAQIPHSRFGSTATIRRSRTIITRIARARGAHTILSDGPAAGSSMRPVESYDHHNCRFVPANGLPAYWPHHDARV